jgi:hypothetical protein
MGIMQLMPGTARELGVTNPFNPAEAIPAGARYLLAQFERFGSWELALAAYNAGPDAVARAGGIPRNGETEGYVPSVMAQWAEYRQRFPALTAAPEDCPVAPRGKTAPPPEVEDTKNTVATRQTARAVIACFGYEHSIYCQDPRGGEFEHPRGRACDFMLTSGGVARGEAQARGEAIAEWLAAHAEELHILYVIWYRRYWNASEGYKPWERWGPYHCSSCDPSDAHYNHVHVSIAFMPGDPPSARCRPGVRCTN